MQGHQPIVDKVLATGNGLVKADHFATPAIKNKIGELSDDWNELLKQAANRKSNLDLSLQRQKVSLTFRINFIEFCRHFSIDSSLGEFCPIIFYYV